jgi:hypothetical protein
MSFFRVRSICVQGCDTNVAVFACWPVAPCSCIIHLLVRAQNLVMKETCKRMMRVLRRLGHIDDAKVVQLKVSLPRCTRTAGNAGGAARPREA